MGKQLIFQDDSNYDFLVEDTEYVTEDAPDIVKDAWKKAKADARKEFVKKQELPYEKKLERQAI